ncbi:hypothetical protein D9M68_881080 [compost metagenome]
MRRLAEIAIEAERQRQPQRDKRKTAQRHRLHDNRHCGDDNRDGLQSVLPLTEQDHAHQHIDQRVDEIAKARLQHLSGFHRPHIKQPIARQQHRR